MLDARSLPSPDEIGPVDHLVVEFPPGPIASEGFMVLLDLVARGAIDVLDLEFVERAPDGTVRGVDAADLPIDVGADLTALAGSSSGLLDEDDLRIVGASMAPGGVAAVIVYENLLAARLTDGLRRAGGRVVSQNAVAVEDLLIAIDRMEAKVG
jgi:hypothetical protein